MALLRRHADLALTLALTLLMLGPLLVQRGYSLVGDMVFVPNQPWKDAWLGMDGSTPRAVPMDAVLSAVTTVVPGSLVQRTLLLGSLIAAGMGVGRLVGHFPFLARAAAITLFVWNPWVHERLAIGQWAFVVGYAVLPWVALAALRLADARRGGWPAVVLTLGIAAVCSPSSGVMATLVSMCVLAAARRWHGLPGVVGASLLVNAPWLVPSLFIAGDRLAGGGAFAGFAARGESGLGTWASLLSFGGIWKSSVVPGERTAVLVVAVAGVLSIVALCGLVSLLRGGERRRWWGLAVAGAISFAVAWLPSLPGVANRLDAGTEMFGPLSLFRDSHRFLAPAVLALAPGMAAAVRWLLDRAAAPDREAFRLIGAMLALAPLICLPSSAFAHWGDLGPREYPGEWDAVARLLEEEQPARTVVLPWTGLYRGYDWNDNRAVLDPAPRYFEGDVLVDDRLILADRTIPSEDPFLREVDVALGGPDPAAALRAIGVRFVLVEHGNGVRPEDVPPGDERFGGRWLTLVDLGEDVAYDSRPGPPRILVLLVDLAALGGLLASSWLLVGSRVYSSPS